MIMKNYVSYEISKDILTASNIIENLNKKIQDIETEIKKVNNAFNSLAFQDYGIEHGEIGDRKYAQSA